MEHIYVCVFYMHVCVLLFSTVLLYVTSEDLSSLSLSLSLSQIEFSAILRADIKSLLLISGKFP